MNAPPVKKILRWLKDQLNATKAKGFVVGMSGGIDSSVAAVLANRAVPGAALGLIMPCGSDPRDQAQAEDVVRIFNIRSVVVDLTHAFSVLNHQFHGAVVEEFRVKRGTLRVPTGNVKPRLRMATLYFFANALNFLVVGTSNRSELAMGYFTKYGDGGADILPLGEMLKTDVRALAQTLGIPQAIIEQPPTAGLWEGQTDEKEMGITYEALDRALKALASGRGRGTAPRADLVTVRRAMRATAHKRAPLPVFKP